MLNNVVDLILELASINGMTWVIGGSSVVSENEARNIKSPEIENGYVSIEDDSWHCHIKVEELTNAQFVLAESHKDLVSYYVRFSKGYDQTLIRCYFPNPMLDDEHNRVDSQLDRIQHFDNVKSKYVDNKEIVFVDRR
jgi:hypothetical protein